MAETRVPGALEGADLETLRRLVKKYGREAIAIRLELLSEEKSRG